MNVYSIYDSKLEIYNRPFFANSHAEARRIVIDAAADQRSDLYKYPADYTLFYLSRFDSEAGVFTSELVQENLGNIITIVSSSVHEKDLSYYLNLIRSQADEQSATETEETGSSQ